VAGFAGAALTVEGPAGDISPILYALDISRPGQVVIVDAREHVGTAVWREIMHSCALARGAAAAIVDGSIRDSSFLATSPLPACARRGATEQTSRACLANEARRLTLT